MDPFKIIQFDIRGTNPENRILGEKMLIKDKTCPWIIPNGSPFFAEKPLTKLYDQRGGELVLDRDYFFEEEFVPFCDLSGRSVCTFIRLSDAVLAVNDFVTGDYQSIGAWFVPRNNLDEWLTQIQHGKIPVHWAKVFGVPPTLPPELHKHSVITEIGDWYELSFFWNYMAGIYRTRDTSIYDEIDPVFQAALSELKAVKTAQLKRIVDHDADYNLPHGTTKFHIDLGNLDNFHTATPEEDASGIRDDVFSTPLGVQQLAGNTQPDTSVLMRSGMIPVSQFGKYQFIPHSVTGSYEGLGSETESSAICKEADGSLMVLSNHFDGRVRGLYFSKVEGYNTDSPKHTFTGHRYEPASLVSRGLVANRVVMGSGPKAIMVGVNGTPDWFVALTNGTLKAEAHAFVKCNVAALAAWIGDASNPGYGASHSGVIHHMGDYLVLVQTYNDNVPNKPPRQAFFRVLVADIVAGKDVTWTRINITYTNRAGTVLSNQTYMEVADHVITGSLFTRLGAATLYPGASRYTTDGRVASLSAPNPSVSGAYSIKFLAAFQLTYISGAVNKNTRCALEVSHDFNPATGVFTPKVKTPSHTHNFLSATTHQADQYNSTLHMLTATKQPATVLLESGELVSSVVFNDEPAFPIKLVVVKVTGRNTPEALLNGLLDSASVSIEYRKVIDPKPAFPLLSGTFGGSVVYQPGGELFGAVNPATLKREVFYRDVTGLPQVLSGVKNLLVGNVNARPLSSSIYSTNLLHHDPMINITGGAADLAAVGAECGFGTLSACGYSSTESLANALPTNPALRAPANAGVVISFPRTASYTLTNNPKEATYVADTFYGLGQDVINKLGSYVPYAARIARGFSFTLNMLTAETHPGLAGLNMAVVQLNWVDKTSGLPVTKIIAVRPVVEAPNAGHPDVYLIKSLVVLGTQFVARSLLTPASTQAGVQQFATYKDKPGYPERPLMNVYRNGDLLKISLVGCHTVNLGEDIPLCTVFDLNVATKKVTGAATGGLNLGNGEYTAMLPRVGISDYGLNVVPGAPGYAYVQPPPNPESWRCNVSGTVILSSYIVGASGVRAPTAFYTTTSGSEGFLAMRCSACERNLGKITMLLDPELPRTVNSHYTYQPPFNPPPPPPNVERWTCRVNGNFTMSKGTVVSHEGGALGIGNAMISTTIDAAGTGAIHSCKSCLSEGVAVNGQAGINSWTAAHYDYVNNTPNYPAGLDEYFLVPPAGLYSLTGGAAGIVKKTVGGVTSYHMTASSYPEAGWVVRFEDKVDLMIYGVPYSIEGGVFDLRDIDEDPRNKMFYVYVAIEDNKTKYVVSTVALRHRGSLLPVATLVTNDQQILTIARHQPFMIGDHMLSFTRDAGIIPVSSGFPQDVGNFSFLRNAELLP